MVLTTLDRLDLPLDLEAGRRSSGVHVSQIIRLIAVKMGFLKDGDDEEIDMASGLPVDALLRISLGMAWEEWLAPRLAILYRESGQGDFLYHPGEFSQDGIAGSPDALTFLPDGRVRLHEFKATWKSTKRILNFDHEWYWLSQVKEIGRASCRERV